MSDSDTALKEQTSFSKQIDNLSGIRNRIDSSKVNVMTLADNLYGSNPSCAENTEDTPRSGVVEQADELICDIQKSIDDLEHQISRLNTLA